MALDVGARRVICDSRGTGDSERVKTVVFRRPEIELLTKPKWSVAGEIGAATRNCSPRGWVRDA